MKALRIMGALVWTMLFSSASSFALTVRQVDLKDLTTKADLIFIGIVTTIKTERAPNTIYTYVTFSDLQGSEGGSIFRRQLRYASLGALSREKLFISPECLNLSSAREILSSSPAIFGTSARLWDGDKVDSKSDGMRPWGEMCSLTTQVSA